jgi:hypothetical protein
MVTNADDPFGDRPTRRSAPVVVVHAPKLGLTSGVDPEST